MDSTLWKINDTNVSGFAKGLQLSLRNQEADRFLFSADGQEFDSAALYDYGDSISLYKGSTRWFQGVVVAGPRFGSPTQESHDYEAAGLWWYLDRIPFMQDWRAGSGSTLNKSHVILAQDIDGNYIEVGEVLKEVLDHVIGLGAPFTYVQSELDLLDAQPPADEQVDVTHGEAIRKMLRWIPDCVAWFDYSPDTPVLHFTRRGAASAVQYDCTAGDPAEEINIRDRSDLVKTGVIINYERVDTLAGDTVPVLQQDIYPVGTVVGFNTASLTINLLGMNVSIQQQDVVVETLGNFGSGDFWTKYIPSLADKTNLSVENPSSSGTAYSSVLVEGSVPDWTNKGTMEVTFTADLSWTEANGTEVEKGRHSVTLVMTNAETTTYTREVSATFPEEFPTGLAQTLYDALSVIHWEGSFVLVEDEVSAGPSPGKVLNLTNGLSAWSTMNAVIQSVEFDVDAGRTTITFGPPEHLSPQDSVSLLHANRTRVTLYSNDARSTGEISGSQVKGGGATANKSGSGNQRFKKLVIDDGLDTPQKTVEIDSAQVGDGKVLVSTSDNKAEFDYIRWRG